MPAGRSGFNRERNQSNSGHRALRKGRHSQRDQIYLITVATQRRLPLFREWQVGRHPVMKLRHSDITDLTRSLAGVAMPDHLHWLMQLTGDTPLGAVIKRFKGRSALRINQGAWTRTGPVWQAAYHDHALPREEDIKAVARYFIANPLRAGLVTSIGDYPLWDAVWL